MMVYLLLLSLFVLLQLGQGFSPRAALSSSSPSCSDSKAIGYHRNNWLSSLRLQEDDKLELRDDLDINRKIGIKSLDDIAQVSNPYQRKQSDPDNTATAPKPSKYKYASLDSSKQLYEDANYNRKTVTSKTFGKVSLEELLRKERSGEKDVVKSRKELRDLNGINPLLPLGSSVLAGGMCYAAWQLTTYLALHFAVQYLDSEYYPVQRLAIIGRNVIVGMAALFSSFCGVVGLGLVLLTGAVVVGILKGELNPAQLPNVTTSSSNSEDKS